ncbi:MAG: hypothetical protein IT308_09470 [Anaerolineaceae bacterium]|nr:hypothetical protein [Anaerolineaceae bacterium]
MKALFQKNRLFYSLLISVLGALLLTTVVFAALRIKSATMLISSRGPLPQPIFPTPPVAADGFSQLSSLSYGGRFVAFESKATDLVPDPPQCADNYYDIFLFDRGKLFKADGNPNPDELDDDAITGITDPLLYPGNPCSNGHSVYPVLSHDPDTDPQPWDIGNPHDNQGRYVVFQSLATNILNTTPDTNEKMDIYLFDRETAQYTLVSQSYDEQPANNHSGGALVAALGAPCGACNNFSYPNLKNPVHAGMDIYLDDTKNPYVVFESTATNLISQPTSGQQIFLRDVNAGNTILLSKVPGTSNQFINGDSTQPVLAPAASTGTCTPGGGAPYPPGRFLTFVTKASNVVTGGVLNSAVKPQVVLIDRDADGDCILDQNGPNKIKSYVVSRNPSTLEVSNGESWYPSIAIDENTNKVRVVFHSYGDNLAPGDTDTNDSADVFAFELSPSTGVVSMVRISRSSDGAAGNFDSVSPWISGNGLIVAFTSYAGNLVEDDTNYYCRLVYNGKQYTNCPDVFVRDISTGLAGERTWRVSMTSTGEQGDFNSGLPRLDGPGQFVSFNSQTNLHTDGSFANYQQVYVRDQGIPPGNPLIRPASVNLFSFLGYYADARFIVTFLKDDMIIPDGGTPVRIDPNSQDPGFFGVISDTCSGGTFNKNDTCEFWVRYTPTGRTTRHARVIFPLPLDDPRVQLYVGVHGGTIVRYVPLITP